MIWWTRVTRTYTGLRLSTLHADPRCHYLHRLNSVGSVLSISLDVLPKTTNLRICFEGRIQCLVEWAEELGMSKSTLKDRINLWNWSVRKALTTPVARRDQSWRAHSASA